EHAREAAHAVGERLADEESTDAREEEEESMTEAERLADDRCAGSGPRFRTSGRRVTRRRVLCYIPAGGAPCGCSTTPTPSFIIWTARRSPSSATAIRDGRRR